MSRHDPAVVDGELRRVSYSQIQQFVNCQRLWHFTKVARVETPQNQSAAESSALHVRLTDWLNGRDALPEECDFPIVLSLNRTFKAPYPFEFELAGVKVYGEIDCLVLSEDKQLEIVDFKFLKDLKYAIKVDKLTTDIQMSLYGLYLYDQYSDINVRLTHWSFRKVAPFKMLHASVAFTQDDAYEAERYLTQVIEQMKIVARVERTLDLKPNITHCHKYNGCPHISRCFGRKKVDMGFLSDLVAGSSVTAKPSESDTTAARENAVISPPDVSSGLPTHDAPTREERVEKSVSVRGRKSATKGLPAKGLFVDCVMEGCAYIPLETWVVGLLTRLQTELEVPDIRMHSDLSFGRWRGVLAAEARKGFDALEPGIYAISGVYGSEIRECIIDAIRGQCWLVRGRV